MLRVHGVALLNRSSSTTTTVGTAMSIVVPCVDNSWADASVLQKTECQDEMLNKVFSFIYESDSKAHSNKY